MTVIIAINIMTMTDTTILIPMTIMQGEVTQLAIMTTTIPITSIRVEKIMESEDLDWSVRRCLHLPPILGSRIGRIHRRRRKGGVVGNNNTMILFGAHSISDPIGNCSNRDARRWSARDKPVCIKLGEGKIDALFRQTFAHGDDFVLNSQNEDARAWGVCVRAAPKNQLRGIANLAESGRARSSVQQLKSCILLVRFQHQNLSEQLNTVNIVTTTENNGSINSPPSKRRYHG